MLHFSIFIFFLNGFRHSSRGSSSLAFLIERSWSVSGELDKLSYWYLLLTCSVLLCTPNEGRCWVMCNYLNYSLFPCAWLEKLCCAHHISFLHTPMLRKPFRSLTIYSDSFVKRYLNIGMFNNSYQNRELTKLTNWPRCWREREENLT